MTAVLGAVLPFMEITLRTVVWPTFAVEKFSRVRVCGLKLFKLPNAGVYGTLKYGAGWEACRGKLFCDRAQRR